jgi:hypothetical protein
MHRDIDDYALYERTKNLIVIDCEFNDAGAYIVAMSSKKFGKEKFIIKEGLELATPTQIINLKTHDYTVRPLKDIVELVQQRSESGMEFWAFGKAYEERTFKISVNELQDQIYWLVTRAEDEGLPHNGTSETHHYLT